MADTVKCIASALLALASVLAQPVQAQTKSPAGAASPATPVSPDRTWSHLGDPLETATLRLHLALEAAQRAAVYGGHSNRSARAALAAARQPAIGPIDPLSTAAIEPRLIDSDPVYQQWLARADAGDPFGIDPPGETRPRVSYGEGMGGSRYPEVAALLDGSGANLCTASLLTRDTLLTAAHCFCDTGLRNAVFGGRIDTPLDTVALSGAPVVPAGVKLRAAGHSRDSCLDSVVGRDIAVVKLARTIPASVSRRVSRIAGPGELAWARNRATLYVVGFGRTEDDTTGRKMRTTVPIVNARCRPQGGISGASAAGCIEDEEFVSMLIDRTPAKPTAGPCKGDSGGPALIKVGTRWFVVGVTSRAHKFFDQTRCGDSAIYTRISLAKQRFVRKACRDVGGSNCP